LPAPNFALDVKSAPEELRAGLAEIVAERGARFKAGKSALTLTFARLDGATKGELSAKVEGNAIEVRYARPVDAFRALGRLLGHDSKPLSFHEKAQFEMLGLMIDVSRNGVVRPDVLKPLIRRFALMGFNTLLLYAEDTYEVPGEPFFGYLRGRYTQAELQDLDAHAGQFGIEMFPCIQALAHLEQILQWPAYFALRDTDNVLLADHEPTYALLEKMIAAACAPFRSKRIHIGMDEAIGIGMGQYRTRFGEKDLFGILNRHLGKVREICHKHGLKPMIWSDMYFRLGSKNHDYYDKEWAITPEAVAGIPKDVQLVYWDYYHLERSFYEEWIERHRKLGSEPLMAGGVWTWNHFWASLPWSIASTDAGLSACKNKGLKEVFATLWGDDGMECDLFSALPGLQNFAEHGYAEEVDQARLRANFRGTCEADFDDWVSASAIDAPPIIKDPAQSQSNLSKLLLWQDPALSIVDPQLGETRVNEHYAALAQSLDAAAKQGAAAKRLKFPAQIARCLALKAGLRAQLCDALQKHHRERLRILIDEELNPLRKEVEKLWTIHREMWLTTYKPFGWEVVEQRYGGLMLRLETLADRLEAYLDEELDTVPELIEPLVQALPVEPAQLPNLNHSRLKTPSFIK